MRAGAKYLLLASLLVAALLLGCDAKAAARREATFRSRTKLTRTSKPHLDHQRHAKSVIKKKPFALLRGGVVANTPVNVFGGAVVMALIETGVKKVLQRADVKFPAMLGGCIFLVLFLLCTEAINPSLANSIFDALSPAAAFFSKWLPPLFVPGLVMLPLSPSVGGGIEIAKVIVTVTLGFFYTIMTTTLAVVAIRQAQGKLIASGGSTKVAAKRDEKAYDDASWNFFWKGTVITGIASVIATRQGNAYATPLETIFLSFATIATYIWGANLPSWFVKVIHPLVTSSVLVLVLIRGLGIVTNREFTDVLQAYRVNSLDPMRMGAGDLLMYLLGPGVVSFAISVYSRRELLKSNLLVVATAMLVSSAGSLFATAAFVRAISLGTGDAAPMVRLSVLARNITTALAMALTEMVNGDISIAASVVCLSGIIGGTYGKALLNAMGVTDPISRGLGMGSSSQGLGVAAIADEPDAFPFAAAAMILTAVAAVSLTAIPSFKNALVQTATGVAP